MFLSSNILKLVFFSYTCLFFLVEIGRCTNLSPNITAEDVLHSSIAAYNSIPPYTMNATTELLVLQKDTSIGGLKTGDKELYDTEVKRDGEKVDITIKTTRMLGKKRQEHDYRVIWNGQQYLSKQMMQERYNLTMSENKKYIHKVTRLTMVGDFLEGYLIGSESNILEIIHNSKERKLRSETELIEGHMCYVVDADSDLGQFTIWLDPANGFSFRKIMLCQKSGDIHDDKILPYSMPKSDLSLNEVITEIKDVKIERIGENYFPTEGTLITTKTYSNGKKDQFKWTAKRVNIHFNPDFEAIGAFVMDEVPDGTKVSSLDFPQLKYVICDGRAILDIDKDFFDVLDNEVKQIKSESKPKLSNSLKSEQQSLVKDGCDVYEINVAEKNKNTILLSNKSTKVKTCYSKAILGVVIVLVAALIILYKLTKKHGNA